MLEGTAVEGIRELKPFFVRCGLTLEDQSDCYAYAERLSPGQSITDAPSQGYCSLTLFADEGCVIQFRPELYKLDIPTTEMARAVYGLQAPRTMHIATLASGLLVYELERLEGISFAEFRASGVMASQSFEGRSELCKDFAVFLSKSWHFRDQPLTLGVVGQSIMPRLDSLSRELPPRFRRTTRNLIDKVRHIEALPWVITHGDVVSVMCLIPSFKCGEDSIMSFHTREQAEAKTQLQSPSNTLVCSKSGRLSGMVDWGYAEILPFGVCLYGLEDFLGEMRGTGFLYRRDADQLRQIFWAELIDQIPELNDKTTLEAVMLARDLGVLLWHGIAFDDGAIDRVVQEGRDSCLIQKLDAFLKVPVTET